MSRLNLAILWHMHQPCYRVPDNRAFRLPWVRLHALKDYYDMPHRLADYPELHATFNLVPVLLDQLASYADGSATDVHLELTRKPADGLSEEERCLILRDFFMANWQTMIRPKARYWELLGKRGFNFREADLARIARRFSAGDLLDLQVWFNLSWTDPVHFELRPALRGLAQKGREFTEGDKAVMLAQQLEIVASVIPEYRKGRDAGLIEISTTPYYHPILPLLCDTGCARESMPQAALPPQFVHPEDARAQIKRGLDYCERLMGARPHGMWPPEGSVSEEAVALMAEAGMRWLATDEGIVQKSLGLPGRPEVRQLYRPYQLKGGSFPFIFFRDRHLSDLIGFTYAGWDPEQAAQDMAARLEGIADRLGGDAGRHIVPVILDGENCWEFYRNDGHEFLNRLYRRLADSRKLQCRTFSEYLEKEHETGTLGKLFPGSWINSDFGIWIGQPEDNAAWDLLRNARIEIERCQALLDQKTKDQVLEELYAAEGSDWCWWYGGNFSSENLEDFDFLFRAHLQKIYQLLARNVPEELLVPIARSKPVDHLLQEPIDLISPVIDGKVTSFYEWTGAGVYDVWREGGTMHRSQSLLKTIHYGFDLNNLYLRLEVSDHLLDLTKAPDLTVIIEITKPVPSQIAVPVTKDRPESGIAAAFDRIIEVRIPFYDIGPGMEKGTVEFYIALNSNSHEMERHPMHRAIYMTLPDRKFLARNWQA
ncbi:MAG: glycoside hydrolase family 57 protein [Candidatus Edwardsbacteria bacterium]|nr:glycoside hydrolase family 57 protein [Candidatus Edwardsbacteria bacterium]